MKKLKYILVVVPAFFGNMVYGQYSNAVGGVTVDKGNCNILISTGGQLICGSTSLNSTDAGIIKTDASGNIQWKYTYGTAAGAEIARCAIELTGGDLIIGGQMMTPGDTDAFLMRLTSLGSLQWFLNTTGPGTENFTSLTNDGTGNIIVAGTSGNTILLMSVSPAGVISWQNSYAGPWSGSVRSAWVERTTVNAGYVIAGTIPDGTHASAVLIKTSSTGVYSWSELFNFGVIWGTTGECVKELSSGDLVLCGSGYNYTSQFSPRTFLARVSGTGNIIWTNSWWNSSAFMYGKALGVMADGGFMVGTGHYNISNPSSGLLFKVNSSGVFQWGRQWRGITNCMRVDGSDKIWFSGITSFNPVVWGPGGTNDDIFYGQSLNTGNNCADRTPLNTYPAETLITITPNMTFPASSLTFNFNNPGVVRSTWTVSGLQKCNCAQAGPDVTNAYHQCCNPQCTSVTIGAPPITGLTYSWAPSTNLSCFNCAQPVASPCNTTTYTLYATGPNCFTSSDPITVTTLTGLPCNCGGGGGRLMHNEEEQPYMVYPNPSTGRITIHLHGEDAATVKITDLLGRVVYLNESASGDLEADLSTEPKGIYLIRVMMNGKETVTRISIE